MTTYHMVFWIALRLWPLLNCCEEQTRIEAPQDDQPVAACAVGDELKAMQAKIEALESKVTALELRLAMCEQSRQVPPMYMPPPPHFMPQPPIMHPMPGYPGWGVQPLMPLAPNQQPQGWQVREINGQHYYLVPVNGVQPQ